VLIVGLQNSEDIKYCLWALSNRRLNPFDVFTCENGGVRSVLQLLEVVLGDIGPCEEVREHRHAGIEALQGSPTITNARPVVPRVGRPRD
jgi:hypothetical protein